MAAFIPPTPVTGVVGRAPSAAVSTWRPRQLRAPRRLPPPAPRQWRAAAGAPFDGTVPPGHALRILTGANIPRGTDTVILQEDVTTDGKTLALRGPLKAGANARKAGEDMAQGDVILPQGRRLTPADLATLAATRQGAVSVRYHEPVNVQDFANRKDLSLAVETAVRAGLSHDR